LGGSFSHAEHDVLRMKLDDNAERLGLRANALNGRCSEGVSYGLCDPGGIASIWKVEGDQPAVLAGHDGHGYAHQRTVGQQDGVVVRGVDHGVAESHAGHDAGDLVGANPVADLDGLFQFEHHSADEIHQQVLERQAEHRRGHCRRRDQAGDVQPHVSEKRKQHRHVTTRGENLADEFRSIDALEQGDFERCNYQLQHGKFRERARHGGTGTRACRVQEPERDGQGAIGPAGPYLPA